MFKIYHLVNVVITFLVLAISIASATEVPALGTTFSSTGGLTNTKDGALNMNTISSTKGLINEDENHEMLPSAEPLILPIPNFIHNFFSGGADPKPTVPRHISRASRYHNRQFDAQKHYYENSRKVPSPTRKELSDNFSKRSSFARKTEQYRRNFGDDHISMSKYNSRSYNPRESSKIYGGKQRNTAYSMLRSNPEYELIMDSDAFGIPPQEYDDTDNNIPDAHYISNLHQPSYDYKHYHDRRPSSYEIMPSGEYSSSLRTREWYPSSIRNEPYPPRSYSREHSSTEAPAPFWDGILNALNPMNIFSSPESSEVQSNFLYNKPAHTRRNYPLHLRNSYDAYQRDRMNMRRNGRTRSPMDMYDYLGLESSISNRASPKPFGREIYREDISRTSNYPKDLRRQHSRVITRPSSSREILRDRTTTPSLHPTRRWDPKKNSKRAQTWKPKDRSGSPFVRSDSPHEMTVSEGDIIYNDAISNLMDDPRLKAFEFREKSSLREDLYVGKDGNIYIGDDSSREPKDVIPDIDERVGYDMYGMDTPFEQQVSGSHIRELDLDDENELLMNHRVISTRKSHVQTMEDLLNSSDNRLTTTRESAHKRPATGKPTLASEVYLGKRYKRPSKTPRSFDGEVSPIHSKVYRSFGYKD